MSKMAILSMPIQEYFLCANNLENSFNVYHIFLQHWYDQRTLIRNADNLVKL